MATTRPLSDAARSHCQDCQCVVWRYELPPARTVMLDDAPGPCLIDGHYKAFLSDRHDGYRIHDCGRFVRAPVSTRVPDSHFLWL
jgi:hypothetical protein